MWKHASRLVPRVSASGAIAGFALAASVAPSASAHIELIDPPPRYLLQDGSDNGIKSCPCGLGSSNRVCNLAADGSDPDRSERVSRFEAGSTITLRFQEFVNHAGRFRVAFDPEGADMADFNANILADVEDPANASGMLWEIPVTLPDVTCDNCTIQLVQAMEVDTSTPIADPAPISSYYSCVDVQLVAPGSIGNEPENPPPGGEMTGDMMGEEMAGGDMMGDDVTGGEMTGDDDGAASGSQGAGEMSGTPLLPVGSGPAMDSSGSMGSGAPSAASGAVAPAGGVAPGVGMAQPLPALGDPSQQSSSSGGCSLPAGSTGGGAAGFGLWGSFALLALRRRNTRARS